MALKDKLKGSFSWLILILIIAISWQTIELSQQLKHHKLNAAELNSIKYGLFDAGLWVKQVNHILAIRIDSFELTEKNRPEVRAQIEKVLDTLIKKVEQYLRRENNKDQSLWGKIKGSVKQSTQDFLIDFKKIRRQIPDYATSILAELNKAESKRQLKTELQSFLSDMASATFTPLDRSLYNQLLKQYHAADLKQANLIIQQKISLLEQQMQQYAQLIISLIALLFIWVLYPFYPLSSNRMWLLTLASICLLIGGIFTPMIEVEAKISQLQFALFGEFVQFNNQVLYFQSKSILDVVAVLVQTGKADMILVGALISIFSILFPATKLICGFLYFYNIGAARRWVILRFFALKSGKWSMADVFVVAIFMAYIGFSGLISSQLSGLNQSTESIEVLTTNGTDLQIGFFLFLSFCFSSLIVSSLLEKNHIVIKT